MALTQFFRDLPSRYREHDSLQGLPYSVIIVLQNQAQERSDIYLDMPQSSFTPIRRSYLDALRNIELTPGNVRSYWSVVFGLEALDFAENLLFDYPHNPTHNYVFERYKQEYHDITQNIMNDTIEACRHVGTCGEPISLIAMSQQEAMLASPDPKEQMLGAISLMKGTLGKISFIFNNLVTSRKISPEQAVEWLKLRDVVKTDLSLFATITNHLRVRNFSYLTEEEYAPFVSAADGDVEQEIAQAAASLTLEHSDIVVHTDP